MKLKNKYMFEKMIAQVLMTKPVSTYLTEVDREFIDLSDVYREEKLDRIGEKIFDFITSTGHTFNEETLKAFIMGIAVSEAFVKQDINWVMDKHPSGGLLTPPDEIENPSGGGTTPPEEISI